WFRGFPLRVKTQFQLSGTFPRSRSTDQIQRLTHGLSDRRPELRYPPPDPEACPVSLPSDRLKQNSRLPACQAKVPHSEADDSHCFEDDPPPYFYRLQNRRGIMRAEKLSLTCL